MFFRQFQPKRNKIVIDFDSIGRSVQHECNGGGGSSETPNIKNWKYWTETLAWSELKYFSDFKSLKYWTSPKSVTEIVWWASREKPNISISVMFGLSAVVTEKFQIRLEHWKLQKERKLQARSDQHTVHVDVLNITNIPNIKNNVKYWNVPNREEYWNFGILSLA